MHTANLVVFGAGGKAGGRIVAEAAQRGHHVGARFTVGY